ncbi:hypothetical protein [Brumimicrobium aurantiacum]|uniref:Uncharacterized protein n=1 Tax=Brumimicrobium aurantiacum TaxID=1737063 RepID=A0A3E1EUG6_9FLAO|nr:hypothetical protein [Brumimicrobium aurantiacum]RFC53216.1 hypothetical protein DXU93_14205 [Brumimicrobium aurantiacum]
MKPTHSLYFLLIFVLFACEEEPSTVNDSQVTELEVENIINLDTNKQIFYAIPSPDEQLSILSNLTSIFNPDILNKLTVYDKKPKQLLNFGVYLSDLAYLVRFQQSNDNMINYRSALEELSGQLGLDFNLESKKEEHDIVEAVLSDNYWNENLKYYTTLYNSVQSKVDSNDFTLMMNGYWIESMYIFFHSEDSVYSNENLKEYIIDQRYILKNLLRINSTKKDSKYYNQLKKLERSYEKLNCNYHDLEIENKESKVILHGGTVCTFTPETFKSMQSIVDKIRTSFISTK